MKIIKLLGIFIFYLDLKIMFQNELTIFKMTSKQLGSDVPQCKNSNYNDHYSLSDISDFDR